MASTTTTYGYKKPANGDKGSTWFDELNANTDRVDGHTHNSTDSAPIPAKNITKGTNTAVIASWAAVATESGTFRQLITLPSGYTMKNLAATFYVASGAEDGHIIFPTIEYASSTTYYIYTNDNTIDIKAVYA